MSDIVQTFGILFSAEDLSSPAVAAAQANAEDAASSMESTLSTFAGSVEALTSDIGEAIVDVGEHVSDLHNTLADTTAPLDKVSAEAADFFGELEGFAVGVGDQFADNSAIAGLFFKELNKGLTGSTDQMTTLIATVDNLAAQLLEAGKSGQDLGDQLDKGFKSSRRGKMGLISDVLFGGFGPILRLLEPLIRIISKVFAPALETLGALVENAFAPLGMVLETIVQSLAPAINKVLAPIVDLLVQIAVMAGTELQKAFSGVQGVAGPISKLIAGIMPILGKVIQALVQVAQRILPIILKAVDKLLPLVLKLVEVFVDVFLARIDMFASIIEEVGPELVETFAELLKAMLPLVQAVAKLAMILMKHVFAPAIATALKGILKLVKALMPVIEFLAEELAFLIEWVSGELSNFFGNFEKHMKDFYVLFIQPFIQGFKDVGKAVFGWVKNVFNWLRDALGHFTRFFKNLGSGIAGFFTKTIPGLWTSFWTWLKSSAKGFIVWIGNLGKSIIDAFGLNLAIDKATGFIKAAWQTFKKILMAPIDALKYFVNEYIIDAINAILKWDPFFMPQPLYQTQGFPDLIPRLAAGGIATGQHGTLAEIGEAGTAEAVVPLTPEKIEQFVTPVVSKMAFDGLEDLKMLGHEILMTLRRPLDVRVIDMPRQAEQFEPDEDLSDLMMGAGMGGIGAVF